MHETQLTCGCPPSAAACAPAQVQFLSIIGTVGGSKADPSTKAFSDGFGWSNFEFDLSTGASDDGEDPLGQRRQGQNKSAETSQPGADTSCSGIHEDLSLWMSSLKASGPASKFFQRQITCLAILCCLFAVRVALRKLQMLIYPDDPPPPDMAFPVFSDCHTHGKVAVCVSVYAFLYLSVRVCLSLSRVRARRHQSELWQIDNAYVDDNCTQEIELNGMATVRRGGKALSSSHSSLRSATPLLLWW